MIPRRTAVTRGKPPRKVNRKRKASEFARCYGSKERVEFVKQLGCAVHWVHVANGIARVTMHVGGTENAHIVTGGAGRKADARFIVPLCNGHHREMHQMGTPAFAQHHDLDLNQLAAHTEAAWCADQSLATKDTP